MAVRNHITDTAGDVQVWTEPPRLTIRGPISIDAPDASRRIDALPGDLRVEEVRRLLELGAMAADTIGSSATLRVVESRLTGLSEVLATRLQDLLLRDRMLAGKEMNLVLAEYREKLFLGMARYLDPESQTSIPAAMDKAFDAALKDFYAKADVLLADGDDGALGKLASDLAKKLDASTATVLEQMAARHALQTRSSLSGRPYEDELEEKLLFIVRATGDSVERSGDLMGQLKRKSGDFVVTLNPASTRGDVLKIVVEAKRRGDNSAGFSEAAIRTSLLSARKNRGAQGGLFVVDSPSLLPLAVGFQELSPYEVATVFDPAEDDLALVISLRLVRCQIIADSLGSRGEKIDTDRASKLLVDIGKTIRTLEDVRAKQQSAVNSINKASTAVEEIQARALDSLRKLEDLLDL